MTDKILEVRGLTKTYGGEKLKGDKKATPTLDVLKGIDIDIYRGDVVCLIGPSGCGKSTFLKSLNRMNDLVEGCRIEGTSKAMVDLAHKAGLYVSLWPGQSPEEFMRGAYLGADALNSDRAVEVKNWLDKNAPWIKYK